MSQDVKAIVQREFEIFNAGNFGIADEIIADDYVGHDPALPEPIRGPEGIKEAAAGYRAAFPDLEVSIEQQLADGEWVVTRWTATGTHEGELFGIAPTGKRSTVSGISVEHVVGGKVVEDFTIWDTLGMMQQIGAVPAPEAAQV